MSLELVMIRCPEILTPERREVRGTVFVIGRDESSDWVLPDPGRHLSKRHCQIIFDQGNWLLVDLSVNGTYLNDATDAIGHGLGQKLNNGDRLKLGPYELEIQIADDGMVALERAGSVTASRVLSLETLGLLRKSATIRQTTLAGGATSRLDDVAFGDIGLSQFGSPDLERPKAPIFPSAFDPLAANETFAEPVDPAPAPGSAFRPPSAPATIPDDWDIDVLEASPIEGAPSRPPSAPARSGVASSDPEKPKAPILPPDFDPLALDDPFAEPPVHAPAPESAFRPPSPSATIPDDWNADLPMASPFKGAPLPRPAAPVPVPNKTPTAPAEQHSRISPLMDSVDVSAFGPALATRGGEALIQIYLHRADQVLSVGERVRESDADASRRGVTTLAVGIAAGQRVDIVLEAPGASIDSAEPNLVWRGGPQACQFVLRVPRDSDREAIMVRIIILVEGAPAGSLCFRLPVVEKASADSLRTTIRGDLSRRYGRAFLSYASPDRAEVLKRAQALKAARIEFFQDLLSLEPGERWELRVHEEIDSCDLFLLFWSSHAMASKWVIAETERARARRGNKDDAAAPDIVPIVLEGPPVPMPPDGWKDIHFNDWLRYVIAAEQANGGRAGNLGKPEVLQAKHLSDQR